MPPHQNTVHHTLNGGILQNGYQLQHYYYAGNPRLDPLDKVESMLQNASDAEYDMEVQRAQHMLADQMYQYGMRHCVRQREVWMGLPQMPDTTQLIATGNRRFALATINAYRKEYAAAKERRDPGGSRTEKELELMDRRYIEESKKRREKKEKGPGCCIM